MESYPLLRGNEFYGDLNRLASAIVAIVDCYCDQKHHNGPACDWGGAIMLLGVELGCRTTSLLEKTKNGEIRAQPLSRGGSAFGSKHNTRVLYSGVVTDSQDDKPLDSTQYPFFDPLHVSYLYNKMRKGESVPTTKVRHDYILAFEDILFIVCEALSTSLEEEFVKIIMSLVKMVIYLDVAYGIISTATLVYVIKLWWSIDHGQYHYQVFTMPYVSGNYKDRNAHAVYGIGCWEIVRIVAAIMRNQQLDIQRIIKRNEIRYPQVESWARNLVQRRTVFTKSCALYLGTNKMKLANSTTLDYQKEVYFNAQSRIQADQAKPDAPEGVLGIHLFQPGGVNAMIDPDDIETEEGYADGESGDGPALDTPTDTLTHSVLKAMLVDQKTEGLLYLEEKLEMIGSQRSGSTHSSTESIDSQDKGV